MCKQQILYSDPPSHSKAPTAILFSGCKGGPGPPQKFLAHLHIGKSKALNVLKNYPEWPMPAGGSKQISLPKILNFENYV